MARTESRTKTAIWSDAEFLKLSGRAQRMYWLLFSQSTISLCGVIALTERRWAATACDETIETVRDALTELEENRYVLIDWDTEEILVRTFARHDGIARNSKTFDPAWRQLANISSAHLRDAARVQLAALGDPPSDMPPPPGHGVSAPPDDVEHGVSAHVNGTQDALRAGARAASSLLNPPLTPAPDSHSHPVPHPPPSPSLALVVATPAAAPPRSDSTFEEFWSRYPRKVGKPAATKAWNKLRNEPLPAILSGLAPWVTYWATDRTDDRFIPHAATWLNDRRWQDSPPKPTLTSTNGSATPFADAYRHRNNLGSAS